MKVSHIQPDALNYTVTIEMAAEDYAEPLRKRLNEYKRKADIKGFRKGMAHPADSAHVRRPGPLREREHAGRGRLG